MALVEHLDDLPMTPLEIQLKACMADREDIEGRILSSSELTEYIGWMVRTYGQTHAGATQAMLPYFTPDNAMTQMAAEFASARENQRALAKLTRELAEQNDADYIAQGRDISIGRMLRYYPAQWHTTTYFEVYYAFSGTCPIHFQNETIQMKNGAVLIVAPGVVHANPCYADDAVLAFYMIRVNTFRHVFWNQLGDDNLLSRFFRIALEGENPTSYLYFDTEDDRDIRRLMLQIYRENQEEQMYASQMVNSLMRLLFLLILRRYEGTARLPRTEYFFWKHQFSAILSYLQSHYQTATISEVARRFSYSTKQVGRIVRDCTGMAFGELVRDMKMKKAAELLRERNLPPEEVAAQTGYATVNSFYRSFTDYYGCPPLEWVRREARRT